MGTAALPAQPAADHDAPVADPEPTLVKLLERARRDHERWINGDATGYSLPDDGTILGAIGGFARGGAETSERQSHLAARWRRGTGTVDLINGGVTADLAWLTFIERSRVLLEGEDAERRWDLRVTEIYRPRGSGWERVHRHADPLVDRRSVADTANLLSPE